MSRDQLSRQRWTLSKRAARYLQSLAKSKTGLRKSFYCKHKAKKKKRINHDELRPIKPLQKTLALQNLLMFCSSSSLFFFYSLTWPKMSCIFCANTGEPHHVFLSLLVFYHTVTTKAIAVIQIPRGISFRAITWQF